MGIVWAIIMILAVAYVAWVVFTDKEYPPEYNHIKRAKAFWE